MSRITFKINSMVEVITVLAIIISLVFVGLEMNENTKATRSAIAAEMTATISDWYIAMGSDLEMAANFRQFIIDPDLLTPDEQYQAIMTFHSLMVTLQSSFYLEEEGTLDPYIRRSFTEVIYAVGATKGIQYYWEQRKAIFVNKDFIKFVENSFGTEGTNSLGLYSNPDQ